MDLAYLKLKIDIKAEYKQYGKQYEYAKKEIKKDEIKIYLTVLKSSLKRMVVLNLRKMSTVLLPSIRTTL